MIKLIIFDMDGVLVDTKNIHYEAFNKALMEYDTNYCISYEEHINKYDGLKTYQKLDLLTKEKSFPKKYHQDIWEKKQIYTLELINDICLSKDIIEIISYLSKNNYKIAICSNSIKKTILKILSKLQIIEYIDNIISNEDVINAKPHPEMFWNTISLFKCLPHEVIIFEDSPSGLLAASISQANVVRVSSPTDITLNFIKEKISMFSNKTEKKITPPWQDDNLNIVVPMAGAGSRFQKAGYCFPKPLIDVNGKPMIEIVIKNINIKANYIFIVQKEHRKKYNLDILLNLISPNCTIIEVDQITEGAACTALLAKKMINNDNPVLFVNSDQYVEWDSNEFMYKMNETKCDGGILTFISTHPKWSFVKKDANGCVTEVAEKKPISDEATVGFYYWKHGKDFVNYAEKMILENKKINNEFYICPVYTNAILDNKKIITHKVKQMWGLGTPEDLQYFLLNNRE